MVEADQFVLCKAALIFAAARWLFSFALTLFTSPSCCSSPPPPSPNLRMVRESLSLTTLGKIEWKLPESHDSSCAVCLEGLMKSSQVWELRNCCHVFHKHCLEKWLAYDDRISCPLCRKSLVAEEVRMEAPSWAVERMIYLFGDDLLP